MRLSASADQDLLVRTRSFALRIIRLFRSLPRGEDARIIGRQLLRSGTSVGAHVAEAAHAKSRPDFCSKIEGGLGELQETQYWMDLLVDAGYVSAPKLKLLVVRVMS